MAEAQTIAVDGADTDAIKEAALRIFRVRKKRYKAKKKWSWPTCGSEIGNQRHHCIYGMP